MSHHASVLAVIPARGGSKGLPRKNILDLAGKPMIAWTIEAAKQARLVDRLILSSDDEEIIHIARQWGCEVPFVRPEALASDQASAVDVAVHALEEMADDYEYIVMLQPTSPLRVADDIDTAIMLCRERGVPSCVSVVAAGKSPHWMYSLDNGTLNPILSQDRAGMQRQDLPTAYVLNGAVYVIRADWLRGQRKVMSDQTCAHVMPQERSIDIDSGLDFRIAAMLLMERGAVSGHPPPDGNSTG